MALSPADFYAYSRATGAPVPEDAEERAMMAPEVLAYRRNQLRAPQQSEEKGPDALAMGLGIGLGLAGAGGAAFGLRNLLRGPKQSANAGVKQVNLGKEAERETRRAVHQTIPPLPSQQPPGPSRQEVYAKVAAKPETELPTVHRPQSGAEVELITDPNTGEIFRRGKSPESFVQTYIGLRPPLTGQKTDLPTARTPGTFAEFSQDVEQRFSPRKYIEETGAVAPAEDLTSVQQLSLPQITDQKINAVESGEDQMTGRVRQQLQRNEDLNVADVDALEDLTGNINVAASQTTDGLPVDQTLGNSSAARFLQRERAEIASQLGEQGLPLSPGRIEAELANRLSGSEAWTYGPKYTQRKQALQLGATYDPKFFENIKTPSVRVAGETIPTEMLKEPVVMPETAERLQEQVNRKRNWLGQVRLEEQKNKVRLMNVEKEINVLENYQNEVSSFLSSGKATPQQAIIGKQRLNDISLDLDRLDTYRNELMQDVYRGEKRIQGARSYTDEAISNLQLPQKLKTGIEEGQRVFFETDASGQPILETMELRSERPMITTEPKGGSGRNIAEFTVPERIDEEIRAIQGGGRMRDYDPETGGPAQRRQPKTADSGREIDIYGIRPSSEFPADPEMRPTETYSSKTPLTQKLTPERLASVRMSEAVLKANRLAAGRNPRGGVLPDETTLLRRKMAAMENAPEATYGPRSTITPGSVPPQQLTLKGITGYNARQVKSPADQASEQLETYMSKLQRGRAVPLTSEVRIQPRLF